MTDDRRLLFVHAHPDDEASKGAATAARYVDEGARVVLVTCTGGEAGDVLNPAFELSEEAMAVVRRAELDCAARAIGFSQRYDLGFVDSGWHEDHATVPDGTFGRCDLEEAAGALAVIVRTERPQVVVTYPEDGGYPHPDHVMVHRVTMRAVELAADPAAPVDGAPWEVARVLAGEHFTRDRVSTLHTGTLERGLPSPFEGWEDRHVRAEPRVDARVHVADWFDRRDAALRCHVSQIDPDGFWFLVPRDLEADRYPWECYSLLRPAHPDEAAVWDDLFAGLT